MFLPEGITSIGAGAFQNCEVLEEVHLPSTLKAIGRNGLRNNNALKHINLPEGLESIEDGVFAACASLKEVTLPSTLTPLGDSCFLQCAALEEILIPGSVKHVAPYAFSECSSLRRAVLAQGVEVIEGTAFFRSNSLAQIIVPASVTDVTMTLNTNPGLKQLYVFRGTAADAWAQSSGVAYAYMDKTGLDNCLALPAALTQLDPEAFLGSAMKYVVLPAKCKTVGERAFADCSNLMLVRIPAGVESIAPNAFEGFDGLVVLEKAEGAGMKFAQDNGLMWIIMP